MEFFNLWKLEILYIYLMFVNWSLMNVKVLKESMLDKIYFKNLFSSNPKT